MEKIDLAHMFLAYKDDVQTLVDILFSIYDSKKESVYSGKLENKHTIKDLNYITINGGSGDINIMNKNSTSNPSDFFTHILMNQSRLYKDVIQIEILNFGKIYTTTFTIEEFKQMERNKKLNKLLYE